MKNADIKNFFLNIDKLNLSTQQKKRMLRIFQVRGINRKNKVMSYEEFRNLLVKKKGNITKLVLGPKWNRLVFVDVDVEI